MTYQNDFTLPTELLEQIASEGLDYLPELVCILINAATQIDREKHLGAGHYDSPFILSKNDLSPMPDDT